MLQFALPYIFNGIFTSFRFLKSRFFCITFLYWLLSLISRDIQLKILISWATPAFPVILSNENEPLYFNNHPLLKFFSQASEFMRKGHVCAAYIRVWILFPNKKDSDEGFVIFNETVMQYWNKNLGLLRYAIQNITVLLKFFLS